MMKEVLEKKVQLIEIPPLEWTTEQKFTLAQTLRKLTKPMIIAANRMDLPQAKENLAKLQKQFPEYLIVPCSAEAEIMLREANKKDMVEYIPGEKSFQLKNPNLTDAQKQALALVQKAILDEYGSTGVQQVLNAAVFDMLKYMPIYPGGVNKLVDSQGRVLPDCFLMPPHTTAFDFANKLHTDFAKNFIRAIDVKSKKTVGKEHQLQAGDVVEIVAGK
jgi:ribosome-binding ATPase YchF (GTP1/OBG family)